MTKPIMLLIAHFRVFDKVPHLEQRNYQLLVHTTSPFNTQFDESTSKHILVWRTKILHKVGFSFFYSSCISDGQLSPTPLPSPAQLVQNKELLFYVHIPFCQSKCHYCNFAVDTRQSHQLQDTYTKALASQIKYWSDLLLDSTSNASVKGIDIGKNFEFYHLSHCE